MARKPRPVFTVSPPSEWNGMQWWIDSKRLGIRKGPYANEAEAQRSADLNNAAVSL